MFRIDRAKEIIHAYLQQCEVGNGPEGLIQQYHHHQLQLLLAKYPLQASEFEYLQQCSRAVSQFLAPNVMTEIYTKHSLPIQIDCTNSPFYSPALSQSQLQRLRKILINNWYAEHGIL